MIEKLDPSDGRYTTIITKVNELIDAHNELRQDCDSLNQSFTHHHHESSDIGINPDMTGGPLITMVDEREPQL